MKYIEVAQKITLAESGSGPAMQEGLLEHLRRAFDIDVLTEKDSGFYFEGTTGGHESLTRHARVCADVHIKTDKKTSRIIISGYSKPAISLTILYSFLFFVLLLLGLAPGSIETGYDTSGPGDALVFLIFGIFIFYDIKAKLAEPAEHFKSVLEALDVAYG